MTTTPERIANGQVNIPATGITAYEAMYKRRTPGGFKDKPVPKDVLERLLNAAVWAPNHRMTEPWRFFVLPKGAGRQRVSDSTYEFSLVRFKGDEKRAQGSRKSVEEPPVLLFVYTVPGPDEETTRENYAATMCAAHNISLACVAEGLSAKWETGGPTRNPKLGEVLGADASWMYPLMLSIGYPDKLLESRRTPASHVARWLE